MVLKVYCDKCGEEIPDFDDTDTLLVSYGNRVVILSKELCDGCFEAFLEHLRDYFGEGK